MYSAGYFTPTYFTSRYWPRGVWVIAPTAIPSEEIVPGGLSISLHIHPLAVQSAEAVGLPLIQVGRSADFRWTFWIDRHVPVDAWVMSYRPDTHWIRTSLSEPVEVTVLWSQTAWVNQVEPVEEMTTTSVSAI